MLPHPLTYFKMQRTYQNEPKLNGLYSKNSLPKIKDGAYVINLDEIKKKNRNSLDNFICEW